VLIFLEMRNFTKSEEELQTNMDKWLYLLRHLGRLTSRPAALQGYIFDKIFTIAEISAMDTREYAAYQQSIKSHRDIKSGEISNYELSLEKGRQSERRNLVQTLSKNGFTAEEIVRGTGLSASEVQSYITDL